LAKAADLLADKNVKFYWMNEPPNDLPSFIPDHSGFPTLYLWPAGENYTQPITYGSAPELAELLDWIRVNSGLPGLPEVEFSEGSASL
jgi:hypothetical protein